MRLTFASGTAPGPGNPPWPAPDMPLEGQKQKPGWDSRDFTPYEALVSPPGHLKPPQLCPSPALNDNFQQPLEQHHLLPQGWRTHRHKKQGSPALKKVPSP